ncbi:MAG: methyltransferase domain-containing protein [bacterium]|nr:methyltransferase domain-containing protein [bacterium]
MNVEKIKKTYSAWSNIYDYVFKWFFGPRQKHVVEAMNIRPGQRVLDVGVGTGLTLPIYPKDCEVVGIDLSGNMLAKARRKVEELALTHVNLLEMDAQQLSFADNSFDHVLATFVISVVPDPVRTISEMKRVLKPEGNLVIVNHFQNEKNKVVGTLERWAAPACRFLGWRSDIKLSDLAETADLAIDNCYQINKIDLWHVVFATNNK